MVEYGKLLKVFAEGWCLLLGWEIQEEQIYREFLWIQLLKMLCFLFLSETQTEMSEIDRSGAQKSSLSGNRNVHVINIQMEYTRTRKVRLGRTLRKIVQWVQRKLLKVSQNPADKSFALKNGMQYHRVLMDEERCELENIFFDLKTRRLVKTTTNKTNFSSLWFEAVSLAK